MTKAELIKALEPYADDTTIMVAQDCHDGDLAVANDVRVVNRLQDRRADPRIPMAVVNGETLWRYVVGGELNLPAVLID